MNKKRNLFSICLLASIIILSSLFLTNISYAADFNDSTTLSQNDIIKSSKSLYSYIYKNEKLPETIKILNKNYSTEQFLYLMSKTVINKKENLKNNITIKYNIKEAKTPSGSNIKGNIYFKEMYIYSKSIIGFIDKNNRVPNYVKTNLGNMQYETVIFTFSQFLSKTDSNGKLTNKITISMSKKSPINNNGYTIELFSKYKKEDSLNKYLVSTKNAPSNGIYIKELANQITKNHNTTLSKAEAIFDWVKNNIKYSRYSNTKYGGENTIKNRRGNCVDTSHALVSLLRASNIPVRYVNGRCDFTKGDLAKVTVAHVWIQVLIDDQWMVADGIYKGNRLGYVTNWKANSYKHYGFYPSI
ncbi:MAG: transglutaminase-like domain-containing protein [Methanobacteriaceae archaeon]|jgi:transglutaminase-like putative cysteine protease|nr:transglutaminase-like domain-containing protein [Candidatus Methanorudis spinitermitis]